MMKWMALWQRHGWLQGFFERLPDDPWRVQARWPEQAVGGQRFSHQYGRFIRRAGPQTLVFLQVGKFVEFYGPQRLLAAQALRLVRVAIARGGFGFSVGFPLGLRDAYIGRAVRAGYAVVEVGEVDRLRRTCSSRQVTAVWIPAKWGRRRPSRSPLGV